MKKEFIVLCYPEEEEILETELEVEDELGKLSCAYASKDEFIVLLNGKVYARGKFDKEYKYNLKDYLIKKLSLKHKQKKGKLKC